MGNARHVVHEGETLWSIAEKTLGDGARWPRIWRYNNRPAVIKVTRRAIPDPDLIYPGQVLLIPVSEHHVVSHAAAASAASPGISPPPVTPASSHGLGPGSGHLSRQLSHVKSPISLKYRAEEIKFPPIIQPGVIMEIRMTGDFVLTTQKSYPAVYVTQKREIEAQVVNQANRAFNSLVSDTRLVYDSANNTLAYRSMFVTQASDPRLPTTAIGVQLSSNSPIPKLRFEFRYPKVQGKFHDFYYWAVGVNVVVELTPKPDPRDNTRAQPEYREAPVRVPVAPVAAPHRHWDKILGTGLLITAGAIVVGTLVEDFFTAGVGIADDAPSFAAAGAAVARGVLMMRGASVVLPAAATAASVSLSVSVSQSNSSTGSQQH